MDIFPQVLWLWFVKIKMFLCFGKHFCAKLPEIPFSALQNKVKYQRELQKSEEKGIGDRLRHKYKCPKLPSSSYEWENFLNEHFNFWKTAILDSSFCSDDHIVIAAWKFPSWVVLFNIHHACSVTSVTAYVLFPYCST